MHSDIDRRIQAKNKFGLLFIDIDDFKKVNDSHGHICGSELLKQIASNLSDTCKDIESSIYRYGGDEFVILLDNYDFQQSNEIALEISNNIKRGNFNYKENPMKISASIGVSHHPTTASNKEQIINDADRLMYKSKKLGKGRVSSMKDLFEAS